MCVLCKTHQLSDNVLHHMLICHQNVGYLSDKNGEFIWASTHKYAHKMNINIVYSRPQLLFLKWEKSLSSIMSMNDDSHETTASYNSVYKEMSNDALEKISNAINKQSYYCRLDDCECVYDCAPTLEIVLSHQRLRH